MNNPLRYVDPSGHFACPSEASCAPPATGTQGQPDPRDLTPWIVEEINLYPHLPEGARIELGFESSPGALFPNCVPCSYSLFNKLVRDGAPLDVKDNIQDELGQTIKLGGIWFEYSTAGNIIYGFYGSAWGIHPHELHAGAGYAQLRDYLADGGELGPIKYLFDTEDDYYAIEFGIDLYYEAYAPDGNVTVEEFTSLLTNYSNLAEMATRPVPPSSSNNSNWPYHQGYFYNDKNPPEPSWMFPSFR